MKQDKGPRGPGNGSHSDRARRAKSLIFRGIFA
jgi:hypothetical protein